MTGKTIRGVWCASLTPISANGSIDADALAQHVEFLLEHGCHGVALFGSTGEAASFSARERYQALERMLAAGLPPNRLLFGAGASSIDECAQLCRASVEAGLAGVLLHPPYYYRTASDEGLFAFVSEVIDRVGDARLRIILYHFPRLIGAAFSEPLIQQLLDAHGPVIAGLKDSSGDVDRMLRISSRHPNLALLAGTEKLLLRLVQHGGAGCLTASANVTSSLARSVFDHSSERQAAALQDELAAFRAALETVPFVPGLKAVFFEHTKENYWNRIRPPLVALDDRTRSTFLSALKALPDLPNFSG